MHKQWHTALYTNILYQQNSKVTAVTTHQAIQSQFIFTRNLLSCVAHLQSYAKVDNETIIEKPRTVAANNWRN